MVCWLRYLNFVSDKLKKYQPNQQKRKRLAIEILKQIEREEGHNLEKIKETIEREDLIKRAKELEGEKETKEKKKEKRRKKIIAEAEVI